MKHTFSIINLGNYLTETTKGIGVFIKLKANFKQADKSANQAYVQQLANANKLVLTLTLPLHLQKQQLMHMGVAVDNTFLEITSALFQKRFPSAVKSSKSHLKHTNIDANLQNANQKNFMEANLKAAVLLLKTSVLIT